MGFAVVDSGGTDGRYTIRLDWGSDKVKALIDALNAGIAQLDIKIVEQEVIIAANDAAEDAQAASIDAVILLLVDATVAQDAPAIKALTQTFTEQLKNLRTLQGQHQPAKINLRKLKDARDKWLRQRATYQGFEPQAVEYRGAWCCDYTEDGPAGAQVATIDIPGDSELVLLAPGCRAWRAGDGTITLAAKARKMAAAGQTLGKVQARLTAAVDALAIAVAEQPALAAIEVDARATYLANPGVATLWALNQASQAVRDKGREVVRLNNKVNELAAALIDAQAKFDAIALTAAVEEPVISDGVMSARELMSPAQAYFNAAIFPGWQKFLPTYRWGTLTAIDEEADTGSVTLFDQNSSAQRLGVNQANDLSNVPFKYMECGAKAFKLNDRVVVQFKAQEWDDPQIIGFLDTPRPCPPYFYPDEIPDQGFPNGFEVTLPTKDYWIRGWKPLTYSVVEGALPLGLTIDALTGVISGTPGTEGVSAGIVLRCTDKADKYDDSNPFTITIAADYLTPDIPETDFTVEYSVTPDTDGFVNVSLGIIDYVDDPSGLTVGLVVNVTSDDANYLPAGGVTQSYYWFRGNPVSTPDPSIWARISIVWNIGGTEPGHDVFTDTTAWTQFGGYPVATYEFRIGKPEIYFIGPTRYFADADVQTFAWTIEFASDSGGATIVHTVSGGGTIRRTDLNEFYV